MGEAGGIRCELTFFNIGLACQQVKGFCVLIRHILLWSRDGVRSAEDTFETVICQSVHVPPVRSAFKRKQVLLS